ncbi:MAG: polysaccharide deacetylase family protein [Clostridia bacterium]|nr:polysaccharide deacetylase family protein [Clostridia bacterium]
MFYVFNLKKMVFNFTLLFALAAILIGSNYVANYTIEASASEKRLLPIYSVETPDKAVAITFDCAWGADDIDDIISTLTENDVYATFFAVGDWVKKYPDAVQKLSEAGMEIGNHSYAHAHVNKLSFEDNVKDMQNCNALIEEIIDGKVRFYRGPYGEYNNTVIKAVENLNMKVIQWDIDTLDYTGKTPEEMCKRIKAKIRNGSIILMHNDTKYTASGLQQVIDTIKGEGYEIVPLHALIYDDNYEINHEGRQFKK